MTGLMVLGLVPLLAAFMFWLQATRERNARVEAERRLQAMVDRGPAEEQARLEFIGIVAHELRSPLSAIIGYQELLADGIYGEVEAQAGEALQRIGYAARQLLTLTDGMEEISGRTPANAAGSLGVDVTPALREALDEAARYGAARNVVLALHVPDTLAPVRGDPDRARTALELVLQAAVKIARVASIAVTMVQHDGAITITISGGGLDQCTLPDAGTASLAAHINSGPALRLAIARRIAEGQGGGLEVAGGDWSIRFG